MEGNVFIFEEIQVDGERGGSLVQGGDVEALIVFVDEERRPALVF